MISAADCKTVIGNLIDQAEKDKDFMVFFSPFVTTLLVLLMLAQQNLM